MNEHKQNCEAQNTVSLKEFYVELLSAFNVCFEGTAKVCDGAIVYSTPNGQKFRITAEPVE